jgi:rare lipoprotein A
MRRRLQQALTASAIAAFAAACSSAPETPLAGIPSNAGIYKIGEPYEQGGVWYYPREQPDYDETGVASWYGPGFDGQRTANGETFDASGLTAAHPTLPMPVNVRVTNLDNGRSLVLRVNDRGPFVNGRIIDVSARAARDLGFYGQGTAHVRVTYLSRADVPVPVPVDAAPSVAIATAAEPTDGIETASLDPVRPTARSPATPAASSRAALDNVDIADTPPQDSSPPPAQDPVAGEGTQAFPSTHIYIQAGAFSARENAERLASRLSPLASASISSIDRNGQLLYRVRIGPYDDVGAADAALAELSGLGGSGAKIVIDR